MANKFEESDSIILKNVRLDHFAAWKSEPSMEASKKDDPKHNKYKAKVIIEKDSEAATAAKAGLMQAARKMWGDNAANVLKSLPMNSKALRNGDEYLKSDGSQRPEYMGNYFVSASNKAKPAVVGPKRIDGKFVEISEDGQAFINGVLQDPPPYKITAPYRGCYVNLKLKFVAGAAGQMPSGEKVGNQVFGKLEAIQFVRDGEAFGPGKASAEGFDDEEVEEEEGGLF